jgi:hypothetical protein
MGNEGRELDGIQIVASGDYYNSGANEERERVPLATGGAEARASGTLFSRPTIRPRFDRREESAGEFGTEQRRRVHRASTPLRHALWCDTEGRCPECGERLHRLARLFRVPPAADRAQWEMGFLTGSATSLINGRCIER